jgi:predicted dehydrogenase
MSKIRFSAIGLNHGHIYGQVQLLLEAGAEMVAFYAPEPELVAGFQQRYPDARLARSAQEILEDESIQLITSAGIPNERAPLGIEVMRHGKDYLVDKPGFTTLDDLETARRVQRETGRIYSVWFGERLSSRSTVKAAELARGGAIGKVVQTSGFGPHRANLASRPPWFFERERYGGILVDIGAHQCDQFLYITQSTSAEVLCSQVGNVAHPAHPELEDFGDVTLRGNGGAGYFRVDWFTPDGLPTWGDGRLIILGTEGYIEVRKYCDLGGKPGADHLYLVDKEKVRSIDCSEVACPFGPRLLEDIENRTSTAMDQEHCFLASELSLRAQQQASRFGHVL